MRLRQIEVFHAVYENGSISAASRALNVSQPAVSKVLRHTESQLGITLFELVRGRLVATDEAHALFREVDEVFGRIASLQVTAANLRSSGAGHLRIGVVPSLGLEVAPAAITAFRAAHPGVTFDIKTLHHSEVLRSLYERDCDLALAYELPSQPRLKCRQLVSANLMVVARPGAFPPATQSIAIDDLAGREIIGVSGSGPLGDKIEAALASRQASAHEIISVSTYYVAAALVRSGSGLAVVDQFTARSAISHGLDRFPLAPEMRFGVQAAWLEDRPPSRLGLDFIKSVAKALDGSLGQQASRP